MKILRLRFANLHSLRGTHAVDFADGPLANSGIFAITGPTGAGKSTILDAITLALFGQVARYGDKKNPDSVMSRQTGECWAEVEFECSGGAVFRSRWSRKRARGKADGRLQPAERVVYSLPEGKALTRGGTEADERIAEITGLDRDRFVRSILLAQGDFAAFLNARVSEQAVLLEKIAGTPDYSRISQAAFEAAREAREALKELGMRSGALSVLDDDARAAKEAELTALGHELETVGAESRSLAASIAAGELAGQLAQEKAELEAEWAALEREEAAFLPCATALDGHRRAVPHLPGLQERRQIAATCRALAGPVAEAEGKVPELEAAARAAKEAWAAEEKRLAADREEYERQQPLWQEVSRLDERIAAKAQEISGAHGVFVRAQGVAAQMEVAVMERRAEAEAASGTAAAVRAWLEERAGDAALAESLPRWQALVAAWEHGGKALAEARMRLEREEKEGVELIQAEAMAGRALAAATEAERNAEGRLREARDAFEVRCGGRSLDAWQREADEARRELVRWSGLEALRRLVEADRAETAAAGRQLDGFSERLGRLDAEIPAAEEALATMRELVDSYREAEQAARLVQSLEEHRAHLKDGVACPLCGATEHPFARPEALRTLQPGDAAGRTTEAERRLGEAEKKAARLARDRAEVAAQASLLREQQEKEGTGRGERQRQWTEGCAAVAMDPLADMAVFSGAFAEIRRKSETLDETVARHRQEQEGCHRLAALHAGAVRDLEMHRGRVETAQAVLSQKQAAARQVEREVTQAVLEEERAAAAAREALKGVAPGVKTPAAAREILKASGERLAEFQRQRESLLTAESAERAARASLVEREEALRLAHESMRTQAAATAVLESDWAAVKAGRFSIFGERSVGGESQAMQRRIAAQAGVAERARAAADAAASAAEKARAELVRLRQEIVGAEDRLAELARELSQAAELARFTSVEAMEAALLPEAEARTQENRERELFGKRQSWIDRRRHHDARLAGLPPEAPGWRDRLDDLRTRQSAMVERRDQLLGLRGGLSKALEQDDTARQRRAAMAEEIAAATRESDRWEALSALIGSADGQRFSRFAQGLTLDRLIALANRHLRTLNPRYSIRRGSVDDQALEMEVVDHYQADEVRPTLSLSGGETFLASLALALGLSELAGGVSRLDSLFIDEGFGTLDAGTLETALDTLEKLRATGKSIGLISHVEAIKDRIPAQIRVTKRPGGIGTLEIVG